MSVVIETDGSTTINVNMYSEVHLLRFLVPGLTMDSVGPRSFCSEKGSVRGTVLTLLQSRSGFNMVSKEGVAQFLRAMGVGAPIVDRVVRCESDDLYSLYTLVAKLYLMPRVPKSDEDADYFLADVMLRPPLERLAFAENHDPAHLMGRVLGLTRSFLSPAAVATYKPRYRSKLLEVEARFRPHRKEFLKFEIDKDHQEASLHQLLLMFGS